MPPTLTSHPSGVPEPGRYETPFVAFQPETEACPALFTSPHSGFYYPPAMQSALRVPLMDLRRTEDAFVDDLFADAPRFGATLLAARYGRSVVDLNRDPRELDPAMFEDGPPRTCGMPTARVEAGLGCLPRVCVRGEAIYEGLLTKAEGEARLAGIHDAYHVYVQDLLSDLKACHGVAVLIDCHSMPSVQPGRRRLADVVLGDRFGSSCDHRLTGRIERAFRGHGLSVTRNSPYAGGFTTRRYGRPKRGVHAIQIELNRGLYMDERAILRGDRFADVRTIVASVVRDIVDLASGMASQ